MPSAGHLGEAQEIQLSAQLSEIEDALREIVRTQGKLKVPAARIQLDDDLYKLGMSSLATVNVMLAIETRFDIEIPEKSLNRDTFRTIAALSALVREIGGEGVAG